MTGTVKYAENFEPGRLETFFACLKLTLHQDKWKWYDSSMFKPFQSISLKIVTQCMVTWLVRPDLDGQLSKDVDWFWPIIQKHNHYGVNTKIV